MSFFEQTFPGVRTMLEADRDRHNADGAEATSNGRPWKVLGLNLGQTEVLSSHATEAEANTALARLHSTCAPFVRNTIRVARDG